MCIAAHYGRTVGDAAWRACPLWMFDAMQELKGLLNRPGSPATTLEQVGSMTDMYSTANGSLPPSPRMGEDQHLQAQASAAALTTRDLDPTFKLCGCRLCCTSLRLTRMDAVCLQMPLSIAGRQPSGLWAGRQSGSMSRSVSGMLPGSPSAEPLSLQRSASAVSLCQLSCRMPAPQDTSV